VELIDNFQVQKQRKLEEEISKEFEDALKMQAAVLDEEKTFKSYAEMCLQQWETKVSVL